MLFLYSYISKTNYVRTFPQTSRMGGRGSPSQTLPSEVPHYLQQIYVPAMTTPEVAAE